MIGAHSASQPAMQGVVEEGLNASERAVQLRQRPRTLESGPGDVFTERRDLLRCACFHGLDNTFFRFMMSSRRSFC